MITNDKVVEYIRKEAEVKYKPYMREMESYAKENHVPIIQKEALELLLFLIHNNKPKKILELGCAMGYSAIAMADVDDSINIDTLDRDLEMIEVAKNNFQKFSLSNRINILEGEIEDTLQKLIERNEKNESNEKNEINEKKYDLIFIDAGKSHYSEYLKLSLPLLNEDGIIFCDNVLFRGEVAKDEIENKKNSSIIKRMKSFVTEVMENEDLISSLIPCGDGIMLIRRK